ncbi:MAG: nicotinamide-nucleotide amidohydrolase family protein [Candidatus Omnitrophica bacterium]|nr:nicotinamide-nucleotide amidohydrolase family protein [Candidatus Omnitrophota bacterium]
MAALENKIKEAFTRNGLTLSIAESCTGGLLAHRITNVSGASRFFKLGVVAYSNQAKTTLLGVPGSLIKKYGAVSSQCAVCMAKNVKKKGGSVVGVSITGTAGPSGGTKAKPVGTVFVCVNYKGRSACNKFKFSGTRLQIKNKSADSALKLILKCLKKQ